MRKVRHVRHVISGATATTSASAVNIEGATRVMVVVKRSNHSSGSTAMSATVSVDGTNYITYDKWIDNLAADAGTGTAGEDIGDTKITTKTLASNITDFVTMCEEDVGLFQDIIITLTETTDGTHDAWLVWEEELK